MLRRTLLTLAAAGAALAMAGEAVAADHTVRMLNRGEGGTMVFVPAVVHARVGDTVRYVPTDPGHNAETIAGMLPPGVQVTRGAMGREYVLRVTAPGVYGVKCAPHYGMGMVALIVAGEPTNIEEAKTAKHPGKANKVFEELFAHAAH